MNEYKFINTYDHSIVLTLCADSVDKAYAILHEIVINPIDFDIE